MHSKRLANSIKIALIFLGLLVIIAIAFYLATVEAYPGNGYRDFAPLQEPVSTTVEKHQLNSKSAFLELLRLARTWSPDYQVISCSGTPAALNGKYTRWTCFLYSNTLHAETTVVYENSSYRINTPHLVYDTASGSAEVSTRQYYSPDDLISSEAVYNTLLQNGFNARDNLAVMGFGLETSRQKYPEAKVWEVRELQKNNPDTIVRLYFVNAINGELLSTVNL